MRRQQKKRRVASARRDAGDVAASVPEHRQDLSTFVSHGYGTRDLRLRVNVEPHQVTYSIQEDTTSTLLLRHAGEEILVSAAEPAVRPVFPRTPSMPPPEQPPGRAPMSARRPIEA